MGDQQRCCDTDGGTPGGCRAAATVRLVGIDHDQERNLGAFCAYHSWGVKQWFSRLYQVAERPLVDRPEAAKAA